MSIWTRSRAMNKLKNCRDLHYLRGPVRVKKGLIVRSGVLCGLSRSAMKQLNGMGLDEIVDLRSPEEIEAKPDDKSAVPYVIAPFRDPSFVQEPDGVDRYALRTYWEHRRCGKAFAEHEYEFYCNTYARHLHNNEGIRELLRLMGEGRAFLFHCHGGKDRTGVCAALILGLLGFSKKEIVRDYLRTNRPLFYLACRYGLRLLGFNRFGIQTVMYNTFAMEELLDAFFTEIETGYGSVPAFLRREYSLTDEQAARIRAFYLE